MMNNAPASFGGFLDGRQAQAAVFTARRLEDDDGRGVSSGGASRRCTMPPWSGRTAFSHALQGKDKTNDLSTPHAHGLSSCHRRRLRLGLHGGGCSGHDDGRRLHRPGPRGASRLRRGRAPHAHDAPHRKGQGLEALLRHGSAA